MEDGLRGALSRTMNQADGKVLILVVVEDGLRDLIIIFIMINKNVLILVVVEDGLRASNCRCYENRQ